MKYRWLSLCLILLSSSNCIAQWNAQTFPAEADFRGLCVVSDRVAWVSGTKGTVGRTIDGGKTWVRLTVPDADQLDFRDIEAFSETTAYALSIGPGPDSRIYKTTDGGASWKLQFQNAEKDAFYDAMAFWDEAHGLALSDPVGGAYRILATNDGGANWSVARCAMPKALADEGAFAASGTCLIATGTKEAWFVTGGGPFARVFHSSDRGQNWTVQDTPIRAGVASAGAFSIAFRDDKHGLIVGGDYRKPDASGATAALTIDGGKTWTAVADALPFRSGVAWTGKEWIAVGTSGSHVSKDGMAWAELDRENGNAVYFAKSGRGWRAGPKGLITRWK